MSESYVTIVTDDISCLGCLVLCNSLKQTGTEKKISTLIYPNVSQHLRNVLQASFDYVFYTRDLYVSNNLEETSNYDFNKLKCWLLTQFTKCVFLESDVLVVENIDDLFERCEFSAASDPRWPDYFDIGVFVYEPNQKTYMSLIDLAKNREIVDYSIQNLLNSFFSNWSIIDIERKIPFIYNCQLNSTFYTHSNALAYFGRTIKAARLGNSVLQMMQPNIEHDSTYDNWNRLWLIWWKIFNEMVKPAVTVNQVPNFNRTNWVTEKPSISDSKQEPITEGGFIISRGFMENSFQNESEKQENFVNSEAKSEITCFKEPETSIVVLQHSNVHNAELQLAHSMTFSPIESQDFDTIRHRLIDSYNENYDIDKQIQLQMQKDELIEESPNQDSRGSNTIQENEEEIENKHRLQWERGEIDYMGKDSFENILLKLSSSISQSQEIPNLDVEE